MTTGVKNNSKNLQDEEDYQVTHYGNDSGQVVQETPNSSKLPPIVKIADAANSS